MNLKRILTRSWLYFRVGHGTYLIFFLSFAQWAIIVYTLYVTKILQLSLAFFILIFLFSYLPLAIFIGYVHYKRSPMFKAEVEIGIESNPFTYRAAPGKEIILLPYTILGAKLSLRFYKHFSLITPEEEQIWRKYIKLLEHLQEGKDIRDFQ